MMPFSQSTPSSLFLMTLRAGPVERHSGTPFIMRLREEALNRPAMSGSWQHFHAALRHSGHPASESPGRKAAGQGLRLAGEFQLHQDGGALGGCGARRTGNLVYWHGMRRKRLLHPFSQVLRNVAVR